MREIKFLNYEVLQVKSADFDFSNKLHRTHLSKQRDNLSYSHFQLGNGGATVAAGIVDGRLYYGVSFCSPNDNFSRSMGREVARNSFSNKSGNRGVLFNVDMTLPVRDLLTLALQSALSNMKSQPRWAKNKTPEHRGKK
jgi:hypothetical protein